LDKGEEIRQGIRDVSSRGTPGRMPTRKRRKMMDLIITTTIKEAMAIREVVGEMQKNPEEGARRRVALTTVETNLEICLVNPHGPTGRVVGSVRHYRQRSCRCCIEEQPRSVWKRFSEPQKIENNVRSPYLTYIHRCLRATRPLSGDPPNHCGSGIQKESKRMSWMDHSQRRRSGDN